MFSFLLAFLFFFFFWFCLLFFFFYILLHFHHYYWILERLLKVLKFLKRVYIFSFSFLIDWLILCFPFSSDFIFFLFFSSSSVLLSIYFFLSYFAEIFLYVIDKKKILALLSRVYNFFEILSWFTCLNPSLVKG